MKASDWQIKNLAWLSFFYLLFLCSYRPGWEVKKDAGRLEVVCWIHIKLQSANVEEYCIGNTQQRCQLVQILKVLKVWWITLQLDRLIKGLKSETPLFPSPRVWRQKTVDWCFFVSVCVCVCVNSLLSSRVERLKNKKQKKQQQPKLNKQQVQGKGGLDMNIYLKTWSSYTKSRLFLSGFPTGAAKEPEWTDLIWIPQTGVITPDWCNQGGAVQRPSITSFTAASRSREKHSRVLGPTARFCRPQKTTDWQEVHLRCGWRDAVPGWTLPPLIAAPFQTHNSAGRAAGCEPERGGKKQNKKTIRQEDTDQNQSLK